MPSGLPASALARHFGRGPGDTEAPGGAQPESPAPPARPPGPAPPRRFREGEIDRAACLQRKRTRSHNPSPRHHNLNPSPTLRELQVTDHVGLTPWRAGAPAPLPPPARVLQDRAPSSAKPPREGSSTGGAGWGDSGGERREIDPPSPPTPPSGASGVPSSPSPRPTPSPLPPPPCIQGAGRPRGIFLVASFSFTFSFSSISEHSKRRKMGGGGD